VNCIDNTETINMTEDALEDHPAARYRASNGALFSFTKGPPGPGLVNSCELPFGFVYTPLAPPEQDSYLPDSGIPVIPCLGESLPSVVCLTCLAYMNLYSTFDPATGVWMCSLCGSRNACPPDALTTSLAPALVSPMIEFRQVLPGLASEVNACTIVLVLDAHLPSIEARMVGKVVESVLKSSHYTVCHLGLVIFGKRVSMYHLGLSGMASCDVFSTHKDLTDAHLQHRPYFATLQADSTSSQSASFQALHQCLAAVYGISEDDWHDNENAPANKAASTTSTGTATTTSTGSSRLERLRAEKAARMKKTTSQTDEVLSPWALLQQNKQNRRQAANKSVGANGTSTRAYRCTGEAIQCAIDLTSASTAASARTGRIFLFTNGCPSHGDGHVVVSDEDAGNESAVRESSHKGARQAADVVDPWQIPRSVHYFDILAKAAIEGGIGIDVLCTGAQELCLPVYQALVEPSAGFVVIHESFVSRTDSGAAAAASATIDSNSKNIITKGKKGSKESTGGTAAAAAAAADSMLHLEHNLRYLLNHTFVSQLELSDRESATGERSEVWMQGCIIDIRLPR
jgi:Sec23/Sec24 trunk domain/Sec23/Sec24 zinc finger